jgi:hypothetical protein
MSTRKGWVALVGHIVGNPHQWSTVYSWNFLFYPNKKQAIRQGFIQAESDDFNIGYVDNGKLTWFGWMDEQHPIEDYPAIAEQFGWSS